MLKGIILLVGFLFLIPKGYSQESVNGLYKWYDETVGLQNTPIATGKEYLIKSPPGAGHPFFSQQSAWIGTATVNGQHYDSLRLLYDIFSDILVLENSVNGLPTWIHLKKEEVTEFSLGDKKFTKASNQEASSYYEVLSHTKVRQLLAKRQKVRIIKNERFQLERKDQYYIAVGGLYKSVSSNRQFINLFPTEKTRVKSYIKTNKLDVRKEEDLVKLFNQFSFD